MAGTAGINSRFAYPDAEKAALEAATALDAAKAALAASAEMAGIVKAIAQQPQADADSDQEQAAEE